jgi:hypothetical protein
MERIRLSLVIPTGITSYFEESIAPITPPADATEIECSFDLPPNKTATRIFLGIAAPTDLSLLDEVSCGGLTGSNWIPAAIRCLLAP